MITKFQTQNTMTKQNYIVFSMLLAVIMCMSFALSDGYVNNVSLTSPATNTWTNDTTPSFVFNVTGNQSYYNCTLYVNGTQTAQNTSSFNATGVTLTSSTLTDGAHSWYVNCTNVTTFQSDVRILNVDSVSPSVTLSRTPNNPETRKYLTATCSATDTTSGTLTYLITLTHPNGATTYTSTSTTYKFSGNELPIAGTYKLDCAVTDQASNTGSATQQTFKVQNDLTIQQVSEDEQTTTTENNNIFLIGGAFVVLIIIGYLLSNGKKGKRR